MTAPARLPDLLDRPARRWGGRPAVTDGATALTYAGLASESDRLATDLRRAGVRDGDVVGLLLDRSIDLVVAVVAVLKAGAAYLPLDPSNPPARLRLVLDDSRARAVLTSRRLAPSCVGARPGVLTWSLGESVQGRARSGGERRGDLAYVIYTSGSTGKPKGVAVGHDQVLALLRSTRPLFGFDERDVWPLFHSIAFDVSVWELWACLAHGGRLVVVPAEAVRDPVALLRLLAAERVTVLNQTPSAFTQLSEALDVGGHVELGDLRLVIFAGEALRPRHLATWVERFGLERPELVNMYGITEVTVHATHLRVDRQFLRSGPDSPIGRPLAHLSASVLDEQHHPVPPGEVGELYLSGAGVARGYLDRPELTAARFLPEAPGQPAGGGPTFRTGDLVRAVQDGRLAYVSRADDQVKVRGYRIELGEVEAALLAAPGVRQAAVTVEDAPAGPQLCAHVCLGPAGPGLDVVRAALRSTLPAYMAPARFECWPVLPLNANGKIDRARLRAAPRPAAARRQPGDPELSPTGRRLLAVWRSVLGVEEAGASTDFFEIGGHSLAAFRVAREIRDVLGRDVAFDVVFEAPRLGELAEHVDRARVLGPREEGTEPAPACTAQQRGVFLDQRLRPATAGYHIPVLLELAGEVDRGALETALGLVARRHAPLRTAFETGADGAPVPVEREQVRARVSEAEAPGDAGGLSEQVALLASEPFDLARAPLWRAALLRRGDEPDLLLFTAHHMVFDGWSARVLAEELDDAYGASITGRPWNPPPLPATSADHARQAAQRREAAHERALPYWYARLAGATSGTERMAAATTGGGRRHGHCAVEVAWPVPPADAGGGPVTPFMVLLASYAAVLARHTGRDDVCVGFPLAGREWGPYDRLIGFFNRTVAARLRVDASAPFGDLLTQVRQETVAAIGHSDAPIEDVVSALNPPRAAGAHPLFQAWLNLLDYPEARPGGALVARALPEPVLEPLFDLSLYARPTGADTMALDLHFDAERFEHAHMAAFLSQLTALLASGRRAPDRPLLEHPAPRRPAGAPPVPRRPGDGSLWRRAVEQATVRGRATAVREDGRSLSFGRVVAEAEVLAGRLRQAGAGPGRCVAIVAARRAGLTPALLAARRAGAAAALLDPGWPPERLRSHLDEVGAGCVIDVARDTVEACAREPRALPEATAFVLFTSGSTGAPRAVASPEMPLLWFLDWYRARFRLGGRARFALLSGLGHDPVLRDVFAPLVAGGSLEIPPAGPPDPATHARWLRQRAVTHLHLVPTRARLLAAGPPCPSLELIVLSGEAPDAALLAALGAWAPSARLVNGYGTTETPQLAAAAVVGGDAPGERHVATGVGAAGHQLLVERAPGVLADVGEIAEITVRGRALALSYLDDRPAGFAPDPWQEPGVRVYRTGDVGRRRAGGRIEILGRRDRQLKLHGMRAEPAEIEAAACRVEGVRAAAVLDDPAQGSRLRLAVVAGGVDPEHVRARLAATLPEALVPAEVVLVEAAGEQPTGDGPGAPVTATPGDTEEVVRDAIGRVLGIDDVPVHANLFDLGATSLSVVRLADELAAASGRPVTPVAVFANPTASDLSLLVRGRARKGRSRARAPEDGRTAAAARRDRRPTARSAGP